MRQRQGEQVDHQSQRAYTPAVDAPLSLSCDNLWMTRVLHVLDHSLPLHSGYTFRTRAIMAAQSASGLDVRGITGLRHTATGIEDGGPVAEVAEGLLFHRTDGGAASGPAGMREWREIGRLSDAIAGLAREWRPDVLHAHSPALCGLAAVRAGKALGIPVVYEIRAFWEDAAVDHGTTTEGSLRYRATKGLETDAVYLARLDPKRVAALNAKLARQLAEEEFEPQTLYVLADEGALALAGSSNQTRRDLIGGFNGLWVLAPGWHARR